MTTWACKTHMPRWWTLTASALPLSVRHLLEDLADVPGVQSVDVGATTHAGFTNVRIVLHETALMCEPLQQFVDAHALVLPTPARIGSATYALSGPLTRTPRSYQEEGVRWLVANHGGVLGDEMGLGKTLTAILAADVMRTAWDSHAPVLIVGPKFTRDVWRRELHAALPETRFIACDGRKPTPEQEKALADADWIFCHYEILDGWRAALTRPLWSRRPVVSIFDEAHWLKNPRAKRTKSALAIGPLAPARIVLTGTPIANKVNDLWPLLTLARGVGSFGTSFAFAHRYTIHEKGSYGWTSYGTRRMPELRARLEATYLRRTLDDVGVELPPRSREQLCIESHTAMPANLRRWAGGDAFLALDRLRDALETGHLGTDTLAALHEWRKWTSATKHATTVQLAGSLLDEGESVVVFCWQRETAEALARDIRAATEDESALVHVVHGGIAQEYRDATVHEFQTATVPMAIIATIDSLKEGVTLHRARRAIMHDLHWVPATVLQAEARIHRLGQRRPTLVTWVVVKDSVDDVIARHLVRKAEVIEEAMEDSTAAAAFAAAGLKKEDTCGAEFARRILEGL